MPATTSTLAFFSPASASFQPAPYTPTSSQPSSSRPARSQQRSHDSLAIPPAGMDPLPTDPNVLFIRPPFNSFPNSHLYPDGLTYSLMAENPEWFLDARDFISQPNDNSNAISYPPHLEPPRGWCPAKKKDLKDRGGEGWPEGEEPRLRCTFCRRTYAGVNAKSMWRRHVFEKHKIAMANRRDGNPDRPRGRGSGKENRQQAPAKARDETHDSIVSIVVAPQTVPDNVSHKSRFRPGKCTEPPKRRQDRETQETVKPGEDSAEIVPSPSDEESEHESLPARVGSPPLTPHAEVSSDPSYALAGYSEEPRGASPPISRPVIPESPYNPLRTPSFRHSPPPLPSDQPWRYPSPSHPLHSSTRDLSLTILTRPLPSPMPKDSQLAEASQITMLAMHSSPLSRPTPKHHSVAEYETPARTKVLGFKSVNKSYLGSGQASSPLTALRSFYSSDPALGSSPLPKSLPTSRHRRQSSDISDSWFSETSLHASSTTPLASTSNDPFSIYNSWVEDSRISPVHLPKTRPEPDSPVLRYGSLPSLVDLGLDLLEPFSYPADDELQKDLDADIKEILGSPVRRDIRPERKRSVELEELDSLETTPPVKKRRMSPETPTI
ncbi:hypothetical protein HYPSUDRAFT_196548 [Hypholoma sublateritium FD-334 SS-4]|uniref:Uncharacterized protein n=1 Tax=Hypholoma sublateritium (strain FD-334 SS-4) TaxID=945553 RepID=A0A0D2LMB7_HYPSF|nr:hypothetical protein HYPSUDRAFT_196548 [Hypholoma sublateritium FD-334 SS-4]